MRLDALRTSAHPTNSIIYIQLVGCAEVRSASMF